jgi:hypothetical protein
VRRRLRKRTATWRHFAPSARSIWQLGAPPSSRCVASVCAGFAAARAACTDRLDFFACTWPRSRPHTKSRWTRCISS